MIEIVRCAAEIHRCAFAGQRKPRIASFNLASKISLVDANCLVICLDRSFELAHQIEIGT